MQGGGVWRALEKVRLVWGDKEVTMKYLELKGDDRGACKLLGDMIGNVESTVDITELFRKLKFICHWANPFKDFEWSNVPGLSFPRFPKRMTPLRDIVTPCWETISLMYNLVRVSILSVSRVGMKYADLFHIGISGYTSKPDGF
ncbi:hypothetical protein Tco_0339633 [Tanacetum coccineum]